MLLTDLPLDRAGLYAILGYALVFAGLILLMAVVALIGKVMTPRVKKAEPLPEVPAAPIPALPSAPGTAGQLKLHNVEPKTAALLMAIVANKMGKPINELRFISIQEVSK